MKRISGNGWQLLVGCLVALVFLLSLAGPTAAGPGPVRSVAYHTKAAVPEIVVDGVVEAEYGDPVASDPADAPQGNANLDLLDLYITEDADNFYFAYTINADVGATNWGKYLLYIDTTGDANGATSDAWGRNVVVNDLHKPEYSINSWLDAAPYGTEDIQFWAWNGSWSNIGTIEAAALGAGATSTIEWQVAKSDLGNPSTIWVEVWDTGGGGGDNAQDTINNPADDWNATDWSTQAVLANSTRYPQLAIVVDGQIDPAYGLPLASDPADAPQGNANLDLLDMYVIDDADYYYFAYSINADIGATNWGKYLLYIDTTGDANGATSDAWGRNVVVSDPHKPEYSINTYVDSPPYGTEDIQFWAWNGSWSNPGTIEAAALAANTVSVIEWQVAKADLGNPSQIWVEVWDTGGGGGDNAQDTINDPADDWNATDWSSQATLLNSTAYPPIEEPPVGTECASGAGHDNSVWGGDLGHDSRDGLYRNPGGPVTTGVTVTLRLRAACDDLTGARVRIWNDRLDVQTIYNMEPAGHDAEYEWWEYTLPASADATVYWYRFFATDGTATSYYEDDEARTGGWGQTYTDSPDRGWQLTIYDPSFETPDWIKNAVVYQIFADRFRDGSAANNTPAGTFFYNEPGGTIFRSNQATWNQYICDPRDNSDCPGTYSKNFYGGDLQGVISQLDYLEELGVTAIYFNPIFESPSNHKYDTTDFSVIDDNFGVLNDPAASLAVFQTLVTEANNRGIHVILDGVFNHSSSDSIYFDRYQRWPAPDGGCENVNSPYRDWYYFQAAPVPGTGVCAGDTTYTSWFGFDSLPKLNAGNQEVRDYFYAGGANAIGRYWMQWADGWRLDVGGDVDPGVLNDPNNTYWEGFRDAVHTTNPDAYIVGEEWNIATSWTLGQEWDATMNYQFSSAVLSFWRDEPFVDNDHNSGSSAGVLNPISPSQLDERLHNLEERYPAEALQAMMNLLGSHDTSRPLFMLDHNTDLNDGSLYENPNYDWSDAINRLKGVALLQMTLPGAPTIYYGDEVGLVGPVTYDGSTWQDDPYNRQPFPWLDQSGTPFYTFLQTEAGQDNLRDYYTLLTTTRNDHPALRTGSFDTLLVDDANDVYAYGRKMADHSDAAVVIVNRGAAETESVTLDVAGYLPVGAEFVNPLDANAPYTVDSNGELSLDIPAEGGAVLVLTGTMELPPAAPTNLAVTAERSEELDLAWTAAAGADSYDIYRSVIGGGGYAWVANTTSITYTDSPLENAVHYYYVVVSRDDTTLLVSGYSNEASGVPHHDLTAPPAWYNLQWPPEITHTISTITPTENIYGQLYIPDETGANGPATGITAQVGYGVSGTVPTDPSWIWVNMTYSSAVGNNDEYAGNLLPDALGDYNYVTRWSSDGGESWHYSDLDGPGINGEPGLLHVVASSDTTAPAAPLNLTLEGTTTGSVTFSWDANSEPDLAGYEIFRQQLTLEGGFVRIAQVGAGVTSYTDDTVTTDETYEYYVLAYDTSFNRSAESNHITATAEARIVALTVNVTVPAASPGIVHIVGNQAEIGNWDPGAVEMTQVNSTTWTIDLAFLDGTLMEFKFTRGNWETVEKEADGNTEINNRQLTVDYGSDGTQVVNLTVQNWRDPFVVGHSPADEAANVPVNAPIQVTWNQTMTVNTVFAVTGPDGPVSGTFGYDPAALTVTFTPTVYLRHSSAYTVTVTGQTDTAGDVQQVPASWSFSTFVPTSVSLAEFEGLQRPTWSPVELMVMAISILIIVGSLAGLVWVKKRGMLMV